MAADQRLNWLGKVRGHVSEANSRFEQDRREREAAGKLPQAQNIILTEREVKGDWDANRVLLTTLGGQLRQITANDLAMFRQNMRTAQNRMKGVGGITARQVIDLASNHPLIYSSYKNMLEAGGNPGFKSDIEKAKQEITHAMPVSAKDGTIRFLTNAGGTSKATRHNVVVRLNAWQEATSMLAATDLKKDKTKAKKVADWLRKQKLAFDCDCERHRYFFRYVATIGGFNAGRAETGYPKIRNPGLHGVACKHVLRVMSELESSGYVRNFLAQHLESASEHKARTVLKQKEAEEALKKRRASQILTTEERKARTAKAREALAAKRAQKAGMKAENRTPPRKTRPATKKFSTDDMKKLEAAAALLGVSVEALLKMKKK